MIPDPPTLAEVLDAVLTVTRVAMRERSEQGTADVITRIACSLVGAEQGTLGVVRDGEVVTIAAVMPPRQPIGARFPLGFGVAGWVAATGQSAEIEDVRSDKRYVALPYPEVRSFLALPLGDGGELVGVLSLAAYRPGVFAPGAAEAIAPFAEHAALLLRRATEDEQLQSRIEELEHAAREGLAEKLHELKGPLNAAAGFIDLMAAEQAGPLNDLQRELTRTAQTETTRLKELLGTLVEVGAASADRVLDVREVSPSDLITACVDRYSGQALARDVLLTHNVERMAQPVCADRIAIERVLTDFIQNALRLVPDGSEVEVTATSEPGWTVFAVADRGPGLGDDELSTVFERFHTGGKGAREPGQVGLGLALAKQIIEAHHGRIWAENRPDGGSRFCFALPALKVAQPTSKRATS